MCWSEMNEAKPTIDEVIYQQRMDQLARQISRAVEGENMLDVATVMAGMIAYCINETAISGDQKNERLEKLIKFMRGQIVR